jgi:hypothetical protein
MCHEFCNVLDDFLRMPIIGGEDLKLFRKLVKEMIAIKTKTVGQIPFARDYYKLKMRTMEDEVMRHFPDSKIADVSAIDT